MATYPINHEPQVGFLHVPKTGGSAIIAALRPFSAPGKPSAIRSWGHSHSLATVSSERIFFCVREPIERAVSAFYSRKRQGKPRYNSPHSESEARAFKAFPEFEDLVMGLRKGDSRAMSAYTSITHLRPLSRWLCSKDTLNKPNVVFIAETDYLTRDWPRMKHLLELPDAATLPIDPVASHKAPNAPPELSVQSQKYLRKFLTSDYELYEECLRIREKNRWG